MGVFCRDLQYLFADGKKGSEGGSGDRVRAERRQDCAKKPLYYVSAQSWHSSVSLSFTNRQELHESSTTTILRSRLYMYRQGALLLRTKSSPIHVWGLGVGCYGSSLILEGASVAECAIIVVETSRLHNLECMLAHPAPQFFGYRNGVVSALSTVLRLFRCNEQHATTST